jgi:hypothetical protein
MDTYRIDATKPKGYYIKVRLNDATELYEVYVSNELMLLTADQDKAFAYAYNADKIMHVVRAVEVAA